MAKVCHQTTSNGNMNLVTNYSMRRKPRRSCKNTEENCTNLKFTATNDLCSKMTVVTNEQTSDINNCANGDLVIARTNHNLNPTTVATTAMFSRMANKSLEFGYWLSELLLWLLFWPLWTSGLFLCNLLLCILNDFMSRLLLWLLSIKSTTAQTTKNLKTKIMSSNIIPKISLSLYRPKLSPETKHQQRVATSISIALPWSIKCIILIIFLSTIKSFNNNNNNLVFCANANNSDDSSSKSSSSSSSNVTTTTTLTSITTTMAPLSMPTPLPLIALDTTADQLALTDRFHRRSQNITAPIASNQNISLATMFSLSTDRSVEIAKTKPTLSATALIKNSTDEITTKVDSIVMNRSTIVTTSSILNNTSLEETTNTILPIQNRNDTFHSFGSVPEKARPNQNSTSNNQTLETTTFALKVNFSSSSFSTNFSNTTRIKENSKTNIIENIIETNIENNTNDVIAKVGDNLENTLATELYPTANISNINNNNDSSSNSADQKQKQPNILTLKCEYGTIRKYKLKQILHSFLFKRVYTTATILVKCLNQITWELPNGSNDDNYEEQQNLDKLNGQKFMVYISDFKTTNDNEDETDDENNDDDYFDFKQTRQTFKRRKRRDDKELTRIDGSTGGRRGVLQYFQYIWNDIKSIWPFEPGQEEISGHDEFDQDMLQSMEFELRTGCKTFDKFSGDYYYSASGSSGSSDEVTANSAILTNNKCANCIPNVGTTSPNHLSKLSLPFWFIQLCDGSVPQIRFTKQDTSVSVKNYKKLVVSYLVTKLFDNLKVDKPLTVSESSIFGLYHAHYQKIKIQNNSRKSLNSLNISIENNNNDQTKQEKDQFIFEKFVTSNDLIMDQQFQSLQPPPPQLPPWSPLPILSQTNLAHRSNANSDAEHQESSNSSSSTSSNHHHSKFNYNFEAYQQQTIDDGTVQLSTGQVNHTVDQFAELNQYLFTINQHSLKRVPFNEHNSNSYILSNLNQRFAEMYKETLVAETNKKSSVLQEKYRSLLNSLRTKLGHNEYQYYTKLYEYGTSGLDSEEYNQMYNIVSLEQQLNLTLNHIQKQNSLIGDIRRVGTIHNIQLVCGLSLANLEQSEKCNAFLSLLLKCSSKTAQHLLLYTVQSDSNSVEKRTKAVRLLVQTNKPSRWLIENLAHETHRQASNRSFEATLMQTLAILAQNERLLKLKELLSVYLVKRIDETAKTNDLSAVSNSELYLIDLIDILSSLNNYSAIESVQQHLSGKSGNLCQFATSELVIIATIHAYRRSINRSQVQNHLADLFVNANSCQIKQEIVQLLIDNVDSIFWEETSDKKWPQYGFNELDQIVANELKESDNNCVHHLIIDYFKRKINMKARNYMEQYEAKQNFNASSFDFCVKQQQQQLQQNYKCDYVQKHGNNLVSVFMTKTVQFPNFQQQQSNPLLRAEASIHTSYSKYSINVEILKHRLSYGHLGVIQTNNQTDHSTQLRIKLTTYKGQILPLANFVIQNDFHRHQDPNKFPLKIAQFKLNTPMIVVWRQPTLQYENSLLLQMIANIEIFLISKPICVANCETGYTTTNSNKNLILQIKIRLETVGEILTTSLTRKSNIQIENYFDYQSNQPINFIDDYHQPSGNLDLTKTTTMTADSIASEQQPNNNEPQQQHEEINYKCLGDEIIHNQIEIFQDYNKRYDSQCNVWVDQLSENKQQLYHWNSTLKQSNLLTLTVDPLPIY